MTMRYITLTAAAAAVALLGVVQPAAAFGFLSPAPIVQVQVSGAESEAQLAAQLQSQGYTDIRLSSVAANPANPHPELNPTLVNNPTAPVHDGWNGTAVKDGKTIEVYVTYP